VHLVQQQAGVLLVSGDGFLLANRGQIAALAASHALPAIYGWRDAATAGGLMSYGASLIDAWRQAGVYTGRILKAEKPADLPVQQVTKIELVINRSLSAHCLGETGFLLSWVRKSG
jgi:putative ABC transport system substrate-binding protein